MPDLQDSVDQPNPSMFDMLRQQLQSGVQTVKQGISDRLNNLVTSGESLIAPILSDRGVQWLINSQGSPTTMPTAVPSDSPDTMFNLTAGQAAVGMGDVVKGPFGAGTALNKMTNQANANLGWA